MSASRPRLRRVPPERTGPIRNPVARTCHELMTSGIRHRDWRTVDATLGEGLRTAQRLAAVSDAAVQGAVECGVRTAYTVIDEYMRRGREAAGRIGNSPDWRNDMSDNRSATQSVHGLGSDVAVHGAVDAGDAGMDVRMSGFVPGRRRRPPGTRADVRRTGHVCAPGCQ